MTETDNALQKEWRHRFYKLGRDKGVAVLRKLGVADTLVEHQVLPEHNLLRAILKSMMAESTMFHNLRREIEAAETAIDA